jgi:hypothetical protein
MAKQAEDSWDKFLNPETLRANLIAASIFITSYEILKGSIIDPRNGSCRVKIEEAHFCASCCWQRSWSSGSQLRSS